MLSHERENVGKYKHYEVLCEHKGAILIIWSQGVKLTSLLHPYLIPNLEKKNYWFLGLGYPNTFILLLSPMPCHLPSQFLPLLCEYESIRQLVHCFKFIHFTTWVWIQCKCHTSHYYSQLSRRIIWGWSHIQCK